MQNSCALCLSAGEPGPQSLVPTTGGGFEDDRMPHDPRLPPPPPLPPPRPPHPDFGHQQFEHVGSAPFERLAPPVRLLASAPDKFPEIYTLLLGVRGCQRSCMPCCTPACLTDRPSQPTDQTSLSKHNQMQTKGASTSSHPFCFCSGMASPGVRALRLAQPWRRRLLAGL